MPVANHEKWMKVAMQEAEKAFDEGEVPVGAAIVKGNHLIGRGHNQREGLKDPTAHAEVLAITAAANFLGDWRLEGCSLYVTKEPCAMCAGAIVNSRLDQVVFGCYDEGEGCCGSLYQICGDPRLPHRVAVKGGVMEEECQSILQEFFRKKRTS
ncbi:MAG: tRNA adenosine(34) deaminase TadA [Candidatus Neomarinimicrobiota bacterium]